MGTLTVAVTGATGLLGRFVVRALLDLGVEVRAWLRESSDPGPLSELLGGLQRPALQIWRSALTNSTTAAKILDGCDVLLHAAGALRGPPSVLFWHNVRPIPSLMRSAGLARLQRFVLVGSLGALHAERLDSHVVVDEAIPLDPEPYRRDPYTYSKIMQELVARTEGTRAGVPLVVTRPGVIFGPGRGALSSRIGLQLGEVLLWMSGSARLPYTYVENCARAVAAAAVRPGVEHRTFHIVDDQLPTAREIFDAYRDRGHALRTIRLPSLFVPALARAYEMGARFSKGQLPPVLDSYRAASHWKPLRYSNRSAREHLDWTPEVGIAEALERSIPRLHTYASTLRLEPSLGSATK